MNPTSIQNWTEANQHCLLSELAVVREALEGHAAKASGIDRQSNAEDTGRRCAETRAALHSPSALDHLCQAFGLSTFERGVLLLCAGVDLDSSFAAACARAQGNGQRPYPTFSLALAALPNPHWDALTPSAPLRHWRMIDISPGDGLVFGRIRIDERILHYLTGISYLDERLQGLIEPLPVSSELPPSQEAMAQQAAEILRQHKSQRTLPVVNFCGRDRSDLQSAAARACARLGLNGFLFDAMNIPSTPMEREALTRLWEREAILNQSGLVVIAGDNQRSCRDLLDMLHGVVMVASEDPIRELQRLIVRLDIPKPNSAEQHRLWRDGIGQAGENLNGHLDRLITQFDLNPRAIHSASVQLRQFTQSHSRSSLPEQLWHVCRVQARHKLDDLAKRIEPAAGWEDIVLPERHLQTLRDIAVQVRHRATVYQTWGFARKSPRGLGITALFAGPSGTGKTMAAEVLANELQLDLYHIDLSQVVSKYIGETEKNLKRLFDAAEEGGAVLLFDEADALFGKRSEVKDSHDRYANIEVSYLLQRMEAYRGLAILTTNQKSSLDDAFQRRIRFAINFSFPDAAQRAEIWRRIFPPETPTEGLDAEKLSRLSVSGGIIRNIALHAAFLAAEGSSPVRMHEIQQAARSVYSRLEKTLNETEIRGWT
jgi:hypothetical protein